MQPSGIKQTVLVTGGCGYVGSHTVLDLLESGYKVIVLDNLSNSTDANKGAYPESLRRIQRILGPAIVQEPIPFYPVDITDRAALVKVFESHKDISAVIHCAGLKAVGQSGKIPLDYYHVNVAGTVNLLQVMEDFHVRKMVFSSSATVYGEPPKIPIAETSPIVASSNVYGRTKIFLEHIIRDLCVASEYKQKQHLAAGGKDEHDYRWSAVLLRYFNPAGAHPSGLLGEDPQGIPNNLMPFLAQVAVGNLEKLTIFGNDFPTKDGTGIRDYLHVVDCAKGHVSSLERINAQEALGNYECKAYNLGAGVGCSVLDMVHAFSKAVGRELPYVISAKRAGDVPNLTADSTLANQELGWKAGKSLEDMCADLWRWQSLNPKGYQTVLE